MTFTVTKYLITEEKTADLSDKVCLSENCKLLNKQYKKRNLQCSHQLRMLSINFFNLEFQRLRSNHFSLK